MAIFAGRTQTTKGGGAQLKRAALRALALAAVVALSLLAAACGGGSSSGKVAQVGTTNSANNSASSSASGSVDPRAFSACMRRHGVANFPDPDSQGRFKLGSGVGPGGQKTGVDMDSPQFKRADKACRKFQPNGGRPSAAQQAREQQAMLKYAQCMRAHGVPKFPDPTAGGAITLDNNSVDPNTPQFKAAAEACRKLVPGNPVAPPPATPPS